MARIKVIITSQEYSIQPFLANDLITQEALKHKYKVDSEIHSHKIMQKSFVTEPNLENTDIIIQVGEEIEENRFIGLPIYKTTFEKILNNTEQELLNAIHLIIKNKKKQNSEIVNNVFNIVAVTSCPTGIAHTFMAAEGLIQAAAELKFNIKVETQGSVGKQNTLNDADINSADLVIIAADTKVDLSRFQNKKIFQTSTKQAIKNGVILIQTAIKEAKLFSENLNNSDPEANQSSDKNSSFKQNYKHLMTGVSYMLPFVTAGGLMIALAFALGGIYASDDSYKDTLAWALFQIGAKGAFPLMVPALSGYIAYSIANRPGIAPGMIGGMLAVSLDAGFLGGIISGYFAGYVTEFLNQKIKLNKNLEGLKPVIILPVLSSLIIGLFMLYVVGKPVAGLMHYLTTSLNNLQDGSAIILGLIIGGMMAFDMGGPLNKAAYAFSTSLISSQIYTPMGAAMIAGMVPPLGVALATKLFKTKFNKEEREAGNSTALLGISFITEGAIPYAAKDPLRVIPVFVIGSAIAGALAMFFKIEIKVPHGGIFVLPIPNAVVHISGFMIALTVGTLITAILMGIIKKPILK
ncbi:PTS fructose transporter subunit IIC [Fluviispira sanaruensis]|uniref:protein-N(pi)-phosphohistidine--D-fructose phosphotransferase n=1 Tax=Fluviispira sanaruensis TaxID=2493639 RepID=A0A4P2VHD2_FLUSA|nr:fructose-specific PTS transporter subunit EIIC [Fluviispira sanaruensis]BBH52373.1 PTS fructose transporter subunit EIIBC [Fluviispira sanaruensis]